MVGKTISHYKVLEKVGQGGMDEVYLAEDSRLDRNDGRGCSRMIGKKQVLCAVLFLLSILSLSPAWMWAQGGGGGESGGGTTTDEDNAEQIRKSREGLAAGVEVDLFILHSMNNSDGDTVSVNTLAAPKDSRKALEKAGKELQKEKPNLSKAAKELEKAVEIYPEFASAWQMLGEVRLAQNDRAAAAEAFEQARAVDPGYVAPYLSQAMMAMEEEQWMKAARLSDQALELDPQLIKAHYFNALANISLGRINMAEESALLVLASDQVRIYPLIHYVLGLVEAQRENFPSAAAHYRIFLEVRPNASIAEEVRETLDEWRKQGLIQ